MEYPKDYSLLRPFDLEAAKRGEKLQTKHGDEREFVGGHSADGTICVAGKSGQYYLEYPSELRMAPLAWVEGRPVYKGDVLYRKNIYSMEVIATHISSNSLGSYLHFNGNGGNESLDSLCNLTWQKPKTKREGWVNIYFTADTGPSKNTSHAYSTKEQADAMASSNCVACCRIEWEE